MHTAEKNFMPIINKNNKNLIVGLYVKSGLLEINPEPSEKISHERHGTEFNFISNIPNPIILNRSKRRTEKIKQR